MSDMFRLFPDIDDDDGGLFGSTGSDFDAPRRGHANRKRRSGVDFDTEAGRFRNDRNGRFHCGRKPDDYDSDVRRFRDTSGRFEEKPDELSPSCRRKQTNQSNSMPDDEWSFLGGTVSESQLTDNWGRDY